MATNKTVLILGAGASRPYGFPTANELRKIIIGERKVEQTFRDEHPHEQMLRGITGDLAANLNLSALEKAHSTDFIRKFTATDFYSVDRFCFKHPQFSEFAQMYIAAILLRSEALVKPYGNWLQQIWNDVIYPELDDGSPPLEIITFNYDRTLEFYFRTVFTALGKPELQQERIHIHHVYGSLGVLDEIPYGSFELASNAATHINLMPPRADNNDDLYHLLISSDRAVFLGFGFDELNMKVLGITARNDERPAEIWASCYGLSATNKARAKETLGKINWGDPGDTVQDFLHKRYIHR